MEKYLPNQSIVGSPFDAHPSGILASLSHALLSTQPPAAGLGSCGISLDLRTGKRKGTACKAFLLSTEGQAWMEVQDQLLPCMSVPRSSSSKGSNLLQSPLISFMPAFSLPSSRMRLAGFGIVSTSNIARLGGADRLLEGVVQPFSIFYRISNISLRCSSLRTSP